MQSGVLDLGLRTAIGLTYMEASINILRDFFKLKAKSVCEIIFKF